MNFTAGRLPMFKLSRKEAIELAEIYDHPQLCYGVCRLVSHSLRSSISENLKGSGYLEIHLGQLVSDKAPRERRTLRQGWILRLLDHNGYTDIIEAIHKRTIPAESQPNFLRRSWDFLIDSCFRRG